MELHNPRRYHHLLIPPKQRPRTQALKLRRTRSRRIKMSLENSDKAIKITLDDLASVTTPDASRPPAIGQTQGGAKVYGSVSEPADLQTKVAEEKGSILLQAWFYLGAAGMLGSLAGWGIAEAHFVDSPT